MCSLIRNYPGWLIDWTETTSSEIKIPYYISNMFIVPRIVFENFIVIAVVYC